MPINLKDFDALPNTRTVTNSNRAKIFAMLKADTAYSYAEIIKQTNLTEKQVKQAVANLRRDKKVRARSGYVIAIITKA